MTLYDDTKGLLDQALLNIYAAEKDSATDAKFGAAMSTPLDAIGSSIIAAGDAVDAYVAALPMPLVSGLSTISMHGPGATVAVGARVCNVSWADLEPTEGCAIPVGNPIDQAIATGLPFRVRLNFGQYAPAWAKKKFGTVSITDPNDGVTVNSVRWWTPAADQAMSGLVGRVAAKYDGVIPLIFLATPMNVYAEPLIRHTNSAQTRSSLSAAGYTLAADKSSFANALTDFSLFKKTRVAMSFNPFDYLNGSASASDIAYTVQLINDFRAAFPNGVIQNNSIRSPISTLGPAYATMYAAMRAAGGPISFQTATAPRIGSYSQTLDWALGMGAHLVELQVGYLGVLSADQIAAYDSELKANAA